jgi:hypothetical protein
MRKHKECTAIAERMQAGLGPKGVIYIYTFSVEDFRHITKQEKEQPATEDTAQ